MVMDGNALDRQFWAAREASLVAVDRHVGLVFASLLVAAATYNVSVIAKLHQQQALAIDRDRSVQVRARAVHAVFMRSAATACCGPALAAFVPGGLAQQ